MVKLFSLLLKSMVLGGRADNDVDDVVVIEADVVTVDNWTA